MLSQRSVPFIMPPAGSMSRQLSLGRTPPSRTFMLPHAGSPVTQLPSHSTLHSWSEIIPRLYISDLSFAENPALLSSKRITHILSTLPDPIFCPPPSLLPNQPIRMQINLEDSPFAELAAHLPRTTSFIRDSLASHPEARVLVHCVEGVSRSVSVVAAYLIAECGFSPNDAVEYIKARRVVADPNFGFVQQLSEYAREALSHSKPIRSPLPSYPAPP